MAQHRFLLSSTYRRIRDYCSGGPYLIGLGRTTQWLIEGSPPAVDPTVLNQEGLVGYCLVTSVVPVLPSTYLQQGGVRVDSLYWNPVVDINTLEDVGARHCLFRAQLRHQDLSVSAFRSLGLYEGVQGNVQSNSLISLANVTAKTLTYLSHRTPTSKKPNTVETIALVVEIP